MGIMDQEELFLLTALTDSFAKDLSAVLHIDIKDSHVYTVITRTLWIERLLLAKDLQ